MAPIPAPARPPRREGRPSPPPPAILFGRGQRFLGFEVVEEIPGGLGVVLWQAVRDATLWMGAGRWERGRLFSPRARTRYERALEGVELPARLVGPVRAIAVVLSEAATVDSGSLQLACAEASRWAEDAGALGTALAFMQAAALAPGRSAPAAFHTARLAGLRDERARAEAWARRAVVLGRWEGDRLTRWRAYLLLARLAERRGDTGEAERLDLLAAHVAKGLRSDCGRQRRDSSISSRVADDRPGRCLSR